MKPLATCRGRGSGTPHQSRQQRSLTRYFPEVVTALQEQLSGGVVLVDELVVCCAGRLDFAALHHRLHAGGKHSAAAPPACLVVFDVLAHGIDDLRGLLYAERRELVVDLLARVAPPLALMPMTTCEAGAQTWLTIHALAGVEGVVAKHVGHAYRPARRTWQKVRTRDTADAVAGGVIGPLDAPQVLILGRADDGVGYGSRAVPTACLFLCGPSSAPCWSRGGGSTPGRRRSVQAVRTVTRPSRWNTTRCTRPWWSSWTPMLRSSLAAGITRPRNGASGRTWPTPQRPTTQITRSIHALMNDRG